MFCAVSFRFCDFYCFKRIFTRCMAFRTWTRKLFVFLFFVTNVSETKQRGKSPGSKRLHALHVLCAHGGRGSFDTIVRCKYSNFARKKNLKNKIRYSGFYRNNLVVLDKVCIFAFRT